VIKRKTHPQVPDDFVYRVMSYIVTFCKIQNDETPVGITYG